MVNGAVLPLMIIVFGGMTDSFVDDTVSENLKNTTLPPSECIICMPLHCIVVTQKKKKKKLTITNGLLIARLHHPTEQ